MLRLVGMIGANDMMMMLMMMMMMMMTTTMTTTTRMRTTMMCGIQNILNGTVNNWADTKIQTKIITISEVSLRFQTHIVIIIIIIIINLWYI